MPSPPPAANPVLAETTRSGRVESVHRGVVCVVERDSRVRFSRGDIQQVAYPRSALKYLQALPLLVTGAADRFGFTDPELAVICASHNAELPHLEVVRSVLAKADVPESALGCGPHPPSFPGAAEALARSGAKPSDIHNNCSGKHAGFLALARHLGAPLEGYLHPDHPVQVRVRAITCRMAEIAESGLHTGIDGCSAPNYAMPVRHLAIAFKNLAVGIPDDAGLDAACRRVVRAVTTHPFLVAGTGRYCTALMEAAGGRVFGKVGAEGVYAAGAIEPGLGVAVKIDDGASGPQYAVVQAVLERAGVLAPEACTRLAAYLKTPIRNCKGVLVGERAPAPDLLAGNG